MAAAAISGNRMKEVGNSKWRWFLFFWEPKPKLSTFLRVLGMKKVMSYEL
jgi:hypothetical protein